MTALVIAEHDNASIKPATLNTVTAAAACGDRSRTAPPLSQVGRAGHGVQAEGAGPGDHRAVIGAEAKCGNAQFDASGLASFGRHFAQSAVSNHTAAEKQARNVVVEAGSNGFSDQDIDNRLAERSGYVGDRKVFALGFGNFDPTSNRGLEPRERKVVAVLLHVFRQSEPARKTNGLRVAGRGRLIDYRPTRIAEAEESSNLVERLTGGIIDRLAEQLDI